MPETSDSEAGAAAATISGLAVEAAMRQPNADAIIDGAHRVSHAELGERVVACTRAMIAIGIEPGERVAIWAPNIHEWVVAALGAVSAGAVLVPLNTRYRGDEAEFILTKTRAALLVTVAQFLDNRYPAMLERRALPHLRATVLLRGEADNCIAYPEFVAAGRCVADAELDARRTAVQPDDVSDILFTSGTTGEPKGVVTTHAQSLETYRLYNGILGLRTEDRCLIVPPFFHTFGYKAGILACMLVGATMVCDAVFDADATADTIEQERVTVLSGPPTVFISLLAAQRRLRRDLSSLRLVITGATIVPVDLIHSIRDELGVPAITAGYGQTEATGTISLCPPDAEAELVATTAGTPLPGLEVVLVDDEGRRVPCGEPGEILVRGPNVMLGYFEEPEATSQAIDADGWLHTGDVAVQDHAGYLRITGRKKDLFIVGGFNTSPAEVEAVLRRHPAVAEVAVIGVPDERLGEVGAAFIVMAASAGACLTADDVMTWSHARLANFKVPRYVRFVDDLPVNASGKVIKHILRAQFAAGVVVEDKVP